MEGYFMEKNTVKGIGGPVDFNTAAITGNRVDMSKCKRVAFIIMLAAGTTTTTHGITFRQHNAASAGTSKDLLSLNPWWHKVGAAQVFTKVQPTVASATIDAHAIVGDNASFIVCEVLAEDMDTNGAFTHVSVDVADSGGAQLGAIIAIPGGLDFGPGYEQAV